MAETSTVRRWLAYLRERSPLPLLMVVAVPQALSSFWLVRAGAPGAPTYLAMVGIMGLLVLLRLMDEVKDEAKDRIAHPERPIPRGLVSASEVRRAIVAVSVALLLFALAFGSSSTALLFAGCIVYALLMYREFFASRLLARSQLLYAISHQLIVVLMYAFAVSAAEPSAVLEARALWWVLGGLGASFVVEVARKLDPDASPILRTYLHDYGRAGVVAMLLAALGLIVAASRALGYQLIVWPIVALAIVTLAAWFARPNRFRLVAASMGLASLALTLSPTIAHAWSMR